MQTENERVRRVIRLLIIVAILTVVLFVVKLIANNHGKVKDIFDNLTVNGKIQDSYNGVYNNITELDVKVNAYKGCSFNKINNYILVVNDEYYLYRDSCLGTFLMEKGKSDDLNIASTDKEYYIMYKNKRYNRDHTVKKIVPSNTMKNTRGKVGLNALSVILKETEYEGSYYTMENNIDGLSEKYGLKVVPRENNGYSMEITYLMRPIYSYYIRSLDEMPKFYIYGETIVVVESESTEDKYSDQFKVIGNEGMTFNLSDEFDVTVDDIKLNYANSSIRIVFDKSNRVFRMFVGNDKKFCVKSGASDKVAYYEFVLKYDYSGHSFGKPVFVTNHYENEGCSYINSYLDGGSK